MSVHERVSYAFAGRECNPYTKAKLEMTNDEVAKLTECLQLSTAHSNDKDTQESFLHTGRHKVIFDTDLGTFQIFSRSKSTVSELEISIVFVVFG